MTQLRAVKRATKVHRSALFRAKRRWRCSETCNEIDLPVLRAHSMGTMIPNSNLRIASQLSPGNATKRKDCARTLARVLCSSDPELIVMAATTLTDKLKAMHAW
jgi:hypothetical protein